MEEEALSSAAHSKALTSRVRQHISTPISAKHREYPLLLLCLVSGLCDASSFAAWQCFVSMQTGNSIFLCLGASQQPTNQPYGWAKSLISIAAYIVGSVFWAQTKRIGPTTRGTSSASFILQAILIIVASCLVQSDVVPSYNPPSDSPQYLVNRGFLERAPVAILSFQASAQLITSQYLGLAEIPTVVLTSVYTGLASDFHFLDKNNIRRNRRIAAIVLQLCGAIAGGWLAQSGATISTALWISAAIKGAVAISWLFWRGDKEHPSS